jgi:hypothetical protein
MFILMEKKVEKSWEFFGLRAWLLQHDEELIVFTINYQNINIQRFILFLLLYSAIVYQRRCLQSSNEVL